MGNYKTYDLISMTRKRYFNHTFRGSFYTWQFPFASTIMLVHYADNILSKRFWIMGQLPR